MSEWWTYTLSDFLLFSARTYYRLIELYNRDVWPAHAIALAGGLGVLGILRRRPAWGSRAIAAALGASWLFVALAFHFARYAAISWAASYFAVAFLIESLLLVWVGVVAGQLAFSAGGTLASRAACGLFVLALLGYPLIAPLAGRPWTQSEVFGVAADPTVMATVGLLPLAPARSHWLLLPIPLLWCAVSGATLWALQSPEWMVLPGAAAVALLLVRRAKVR